VFRYSTSFYGAGAPVTWIIQVRPGHGRERVGLRGNVASLAFLLPGFKYIHDVAHLPKTGSHARHHRWRHFERLMDEALRAAASIRHAKFKAVTR
jgi:hypothetical protein